MSSKNFNSFKDFQSDQNNTDKFKCKLFTAHYACSNSDLNLKPVTGTTNGFIFQIVNSLIESWGVRLTCFDCKTLRADIVQLYTGLDLQIFCDTVCIYKSKINSNRKRYNNIIYDNNN